MHQNNHTAAVFEKTQETTMNLNPKQSFLIEFKGNILQLQHWHPEILSTQSTTFTREL